MNAFNHGDDHIKLIPILAHMIEARAYLELGIYNGDCISEVVKAMPLGSLAVGVDTRKPERPIEGYTFIQSTTTQFIDGKIEEYPLFDLVFIDADHDLDAVDEDFFGVLSRVRDQGLILLHDTFPQSLEFTEPGYCGTAYKFAERESSGDYGRYEVCTLSYHPGLTIVRKRTKHLPWL